MTAPNITDKVNNAEKAVEAAAISKINAAKHNVTGALAKAIPKPKIPEIPKLPAIPSMPKLPAIPSIPAIPNLDFSIPSAAAMLKKLLPKIKLPSFKFKVEIPKFKMPARPDWKGPPKMEPPKLPAGLGSPLKLPSLPSLPTIPGLSGITDAITGAVDQAQSAVAGAVDQAQSAVADATAQAQAFGDQPTLGSVADGIWGTDAEIAARKVTDTIKGKALAAKWGITTIRQRTDLADKLLNEGRDADANEVDSIIDAALTR